MSDKQRTDQSKPWYQVKFVCKGISYKAVINGDMDSDDELTLDIQGRIVTYEQEKKCAN